jgi:hypothetical protein
MFVYSSQTGSTLGVRCCVSNLPPHWYTQCKCCVIVYCLSRLLFVQHFVVIVFVPIDSFIIISLRILNIQACFVFLFRNSRKSPNDFKVVAGIHTLKTPESTKQVVSVKSIIVHENYNSRLFENDTALLELASNLTFNDFVSPVCLPTVDFPDQTACVNTGWGATNPFGTTIWLGLLL